MDAGLLSKLFGSDQRWHGACTVIMNAEAALRTHGSDSIVSGGVKMFAPRTVSGRINADAVCLLQDHSALLIIQQQKVRQDTGEDVIKQFLTDHGTGAAPSRVCSQGGLARWSAPTPVGSCAGDLRGVTVAHVARTTSVSPSLRALT